MIACERREIPAITLHSQRFGPIADPTAIMAISPAWGGICAALGILRGRGLQRNGAIKGSMGGGREGGNYD